MPQTTVSDLVARAQEAGLCGAIPRRRTGGSSTFAYPMQGERRLALCIRSLQDDRAELERTLAAASRRLRSL